MRLKRRKLLKVYNQLPKGWKIINGALTAPLGYIWISNNQSRFKGQRKSGIIKTKNLKEEIK